jgi:hypothetical protein
MYYNNVGLDFVSICVIDSKDLRLMLCPTYAHNAHTTHTIIRSKELGFVTTIEKMSAKP